MMTIKTEEEQVKDALDLLAKWQRYFDWKQRQEEEALVQEYRVLLLRVRV